MSEEPIGEYQEGRMPRWLFFIWVLFVLWGAAYLIRYALPNLKLWASPTPPVKEGTRL